MKTWIALALVLTPSIRAVADAPRTITLASTCVEIDASRDNLDERERAHARLLLIRTLEREEVLVVERGCTETWTAAHERTGDTVTVHLRGPGGARRATGVAPADLPDTYRDMVKSILARARIAPP